MPSRLAIFCPSFDNGGVERMLVNLANGLARTGVQVDFFVSSRERPYLGTLADGTRLFVLGSRRAANVLPRMCEYLEAEPPDALLSAKDEADELAARLRRETSAPTRFYIRAVVNVSQRMRWRAPWRRRGIRRRMRRIYRDVDGVIAVSRGVADDVAALAGVGAERIAVAPNPVVTDDLFELARAPAEHPWLDEDHHPLLVGVGRLGRQKNFELLLRAFARVHGSTPALLIILGEGRQRERLERLARKLDIAERVSMSGFVENPYPFLRRADLFVSSSRWEGSPNALTEALALGTPVVSTDCPSGPREILDGGRYGRLVPLDDPRALARAIEDELREPHAPALLEAAASRFTVAASVRAYRTAMGLQE